MELEFFTEDVQHPVTTDKADHDDIPIRHFFETWQFGIRAKCGRFKI